MSPAPRGRPVRTDRVRARMRERGLRQVDLAELLETGQPSISAALRPGATMTLDRAYDWARVLGMELADVVEM